MSSTITDPHILAAWDAGRGQSPTRQGLALLALVTPQTSQDSLAALTIGQRNAHLLALYAGLATDELAAQITCPQCGAELEFGLPVHDLLASQPDEPPAPLYPLATDDFQINFRLPDSRDLLAIETASTVEAARAALLERCITSAQYDGQRIPAAHLPGAVCEAVEAAMEDADPLAAIRLALTCSECDHAFHAPLDVVAFVWATIVQRARRILADVHALARAYGWSESTILALSAARRRAYLDLVGA